MGRLLREKSIAIDLVQCSPSIRTRETAKRVFAEQKCSPRINYLDDLYHASPDQITQILCQIAEPNSCVMVIGHNPGFAEFLDRVTGVCDSFPTSALAWIELKLDRWNQFSEQTRGELKQMWRPRDLEVE